MATYNTTGSKAAKAQHTPGPWMVSGSLKASIADKSGDIAWASRRRGLPCEANARLIAAAPDLEHGLSMSNDALHATYVWIAKNAKDIDGASVIGAMLQEQHAENVKILGKIIR